MEEPWINMVHVRRAAGTVGNPSRGLSPVGTGGGTGVSGDTNLTTPGSGALLFTRQTCFLFLTVLKLQCGMNGIYYSVQEESTYLAYALSFIAFLPLVNLPLV